MLTEPTTTLTLAPADISRADSQFGFARPEATSVQVSVGEQPVVIPEARVIGFQELVTSDYGLVFFIKVAIFGAMLLMGNHGRNMQTG